MFPSLGSVVAAFVLVLTLTFALGFDATHPLTAGTVMAVAYLIDNLVHRREAAVTASQIEQGRGPGDVERINRFIAAVTSQDLETSSRLLDQGLDPDSLVTPLAGENVYLAGATLLHWTAKVSAGATQLLIAYGAKVDPRSMQGETPLHWAARAGTTEAGALLLGNGAHIGAKNEHGCQPLHLAAVNSHLEMVRLLLSRGADVLGETNDRWTPYKFALRRGLKPVPGQQEVAALLRSAQDTALGERVPRPK